MIPIIELYRTYCDEFVNKQDASKCSELMSDDYTMHFKGVEYVGRATGYEPAVGPLFEMFPDLTVTLHEALTDGDRLATRFTLDAHSTKHGGNRCAWGGVAIYTWDGARFTSVWVEEDHHLSRIQLRSGNYDPPVQLPGPSDPWSVQPSQPADGAVEAANEWLSGQGGVVDALLVCGNRFAFHTSSPTIHVAGMATVHADGSVTDLSTFTDGGTP